MVSDFAFSVNKKINNFIIEACIFPVLSPVFNLINEVPTLISAKIP